MDIAGTSFEDPQSTFLICYSNCLTSKDKKISLLCNNIQELKCIEQNLCLLFPQNQTS